MKKKRQVLILLGWHDERVQRALAHLGGTDGHSPPLQTAATSL